MKRIYKQSFRNIFKNQNRNAEMAQKHFPNPFEDYWPGPPIMSDNDNIRGNSKITMGLNAKWQEMVNKLRFLENKDNTVYTGSAGIALLKLKKNNSESSTVLQDVLSLLGLNKLKGKRQTFLCGDAGPLSLGIVVNYKLGNLQQMHDLITKLKRLDSDVLNIHSDLPNEFLYGRAGYLYAILYVNKNVQPAPFDDNFVRQIIEAILISGRNLAKANRFKCPLMYEWHDSYYLGAAHGISGILYLLLQVREYLTEDDLNVLIKPTIDYLKTQRFPSGNFPSSLGRDTDKLVQWCHGAPGFVYLFSAAYKVFHDPQYLQIACECGEVVWQRGLLRKGYSLCHGVSGNAYCFLELYQTTREEKHLYRAIRFAEWCFDYTQEHEERPPDRPLSLYEGIAGPVYLLLDIQRPLDAKFPGFTL